MIAEIVTIRGKIIKRPILHQNGVYSLGGRWAVNSKFSKGGWGSLEDLKSAILETNFYASVKILNQ